MSRGDPVPDYTVTYNAKCERCGKTAPLTLVNAEEQKRMICTPCRRSLRGLPKHSQERS